jgi:DNA mismatch endonuclease (patch repair protein)
VQHRVPGNNRRKIDVALTRARVAVYVDGCFWHGCDAHAHLPATNREWWTWKLQQTRARDRDTDRELRAAGWVVVRVWEHEPVSGAADRVEAAYRTALLRPDHGAG